MDVSLGELWEMVVDREAWRAAIHELSNWTELIYITLLVSGVQHSKYV